MVGGRNSIDRLEAMKGRVGDNQAKGVDVSLGVKPRRGGLATTKRKG
jgi:hypothetical protein